MKRPVFLKQKNMLRVLYALVPVAIGGVYYFGWRVVGTLAVSFLFGFLTEWSMVSRRGGKVSYACFVTSALYGLSLPPTVPFWMAIVGIVIAILFAKEMFGGFGRNVFNPAIVGRLFVYVCFPLELTSRFVPAFRGFPGGFAHWSFASLRDAPSFLTQTGLAKTDAITAATPMWAGRDFGFVTDISSLFFGNIGGVFEFGGQQKVLSAGSVGEVCAILILLSGVYLIYTRTARWRLILSTLLGAAFLTVLLRNVSGIHAVPSLPFTLFSGALMYAAVFMVTDPVSAPNLPVSQWTYGALIGMMIVLFRFKGIFAGGVAFSLLLGNMLSPSLDLWIRRIRSREDGGARPA